MSSNENKIEIKRMKTDYGEYLDVSSDRLKNTISITKLYDTEWFSLVASPREEGLTSMSAHMNICPKTAKAISDFIREQLYGKSEMIELVVDNTKEPA